MRVVRRLNHAEKVVMRSGSPAPDDPYLTEKQWERLPWVKRFEEHDPQTRALIRQYKEMERFAHSGTVIDRLEEWRWLESMGDTNAKQRFIEPMIGAVQRDPVAHEDKLVFLLIVCEPIRRTVSKAFMRIRDGLGDRKIEQQAWHRREEARRLGEVERETLYDVTRAATLDALYRYPAPAPAHFFSWLKATVAHGALDHLNRELPELQTSKHTGAEAEALAQALQGLDSLTPPAMREAPNRDRWRGQIGLRSVFAISDAYFEHAAVRTTCSAAVGRLAPRQREVVEHIFFAMGDPADLAAKRNVATSTIYNHKAQALRNLHDDDVFFTGLYALGRVRDQARAKVMRERYPDGITADGRRIVVIDQAA